MDATALHNQLMDALRAIPELGGRIHDGYVPNTVPVDAAGYIRPYVLVMSGIPTDIDDPDLTGSTDLNVADWYPQTNCVGANPDHARKCAQIVSNALTDARIGNHWLKRDNETFRVSTPILDTQVTPTRHFLPLSWRLTTN